MLTNTPHLRSVVNHDGAVILDIPGNQITTLNATAAYIWARLQEGKGTDEIVAELARDTGHDPLVVERDVQEFLRQLIEKHLLQD